MRGLAAIIVRELAGKWLVLVAAAVAAVLPLVAALIPGIDEVVAEDARVAWAIRLGTTTAVVVGLGLGATAFSIAPARNRLGFDLARPISVFGLWAIRTAVATAIALLCGVLVAAPTLLVAAPTWVEIASRLPLALVLGVLSVPVGHLGTLAYRSRSALALVDIAAILVGSLVWGWIYLETFLLAGTWMSLRERSWSVTGVFDLDTLVFGAAGATALFVASAAAAVYGRAELRASRWAASVALWSVLVANIALLALHMVWVLTPTPADLVDILRVRPAAQGNWVLVEGIARAEAHSRFLVDPSTGKWERIGVTAWSLYGDQISPSGSNAVTTSPRGSAHHQFFAPSIDLAFRTATLSDDGVDLRAVEVAEPNLLANRTQWSPDETRMVRVNKGFWVRVHEFPGGRLLCELPATHQLLGQMTRFVDEGTVRLANDYTPDCSAPGCVTDTPRQIEIVDLDVETCATSVVGEITGLRAVSHVYIFADPTGERMVVSAGEQRTLHDQRGALIATLLDEPETPETKVGFIGDGRFVMSTRLDSTLELRVYSRDGELERTIELPDGEFLRLGCEVKPSVLMLGVAPRDHAWHLAQLVTVDLDSGSVEQIGEGMVPALLLPDLALGSPASVPEPGAPGTLLCLRTSESAGPRSMMWHQHRRGPYRASLVRIDPETGEQEVLLGR